MPEASFPITIFVAAIAAITVTAMAASWIHLQHNAEDTRVCRLQPPFTQLRELGVCISDLITMIEPSLFGDNRRVDNQSQRSGIHNDIVVILFSVPHTQPLEELLREKLRRFGEIDPAKNIELR